MMLLLHVYRTQLKDITNTIAGRAMRIERNGEDIAVVTGQLGDLLHSKDTTK